MISRRRFGQAFAAGLAATSLAACSSGTPAATPDAGPDLRAGSGEHTSLGPVKHVEAGVLNMAYHEFGPATGRPVLLLHGWPYDPYSYVDVAPILAAAGYRVIVPYLRGYGPTVFKSAETVRNGQQTAVALDVIALMDALKIDKAVLGGYDWGGRTVDIIAALWPERCKAVVAVSGYIVTNLAANEVRSLSYRLQVKKVGNHQLQVTARGQGVADALKRDIEVLPDLQRLSAVRSSYRYSWRQIHGWRRRS